MSGNNALQNSIPLDPAILVEMTALRYGKREAGNGEQ
jgi:hypothetical protein